MRVLFYLLFFSGRVYLEPVLIKQTCVLIGSSQRLHRQRTGGCGGRVVTIPSGDCFNGEESEPPTGVLTSCLLSPGFGPFYSCEREAGGESNGIVPFVNVAKFFFEVALIKAILCFDTVIGSDRNFGLGSFESTRSTVCSGFGGVGVL